MEQTSDYYLLKDIDSEKEPVVFEREAETDGPKQYIPGGWRNVTRKLTLAARSADRGLCAIGAGLVIPDRPHNSGKRGFYFDTGNVMAFRGISGKDLAMYWHMVVIADLLTTQKSKLQWVFDLKREHVPMLMEMKARSMVFMAENEEPLAAKYGAAAIARALRSQMQFGFHATPSAGYLHLNVLLGPLTVFGGEAECRGNWVHLDEVIEILMAEGDMLKYQYTEL